MQVTGTIHLILPEPNFVLRFGEPSAYKDFTFHVSKTWRNRLKWWLFCQFFPCKIVKWEKV